MYVRWKREVRAAYTYTRYIKFTHIRCDVHIYTCTRLCPKYDIRWISNRAVQYVYGRMSVDLRSLSRKSCRIRVCRTLCGSNELFDADDE